MSEKPGVREGWGVLRPGDRKHHYYRNMDSLCRRVGFYTGWLDPDNGVAGPGDCAACRRKLDAERAKSAKDQT